MIDLLTACKIVKGNFSGYKYFIYAGETDNYFILADIGDHGEELYDSVFSVDKKTGEVDVWFPPDHIGENRKELEVPEQYRYHGEIK